MSSGESSRFGDYFGDFMTKMSGLKGDDKERFSSLVRELVDALGDGHSCLSLGQEDSELLARAEVVGNDDKSPLVLSSGRLTTGRCYGYEKNLAVSLRHLADSRGALAGEEKEVLLDRFFSESHDEEDLQRKAAAMALEKRLTIISGGPGTGKTTTVVKILACLLSVLGGKTRIGLAAPTGKAAMRLRESVGRSLAPLPLAEDLKKQIPGEAYTLHRLLGVRRHSVSFQHNRSRPLMLDVLVVDEASMVDLAMMSKLVDALHPETRLILIGDKDQLVSVESGAVLSDCIRGLPDNTVHLEKSYRFDENIARFAGAMNDGRVDLVESLLTDDQPTNLYFDRGDLVKEAAEKYLDYMHSALAVTDEEGLEDLFQQLNRFRILCATRRGPNGVEMMNSGVERYLERSGYDCSLPWYVGRPLIVRENSYSLGLFNGDIGICLADKEDEFKRKIWFESEKGGFRALSPSRLPSHETVFGMTIHKSQGSEFDNLLICLPDEPSPVLCRELLYTGVTRARKQVAVRAKKEILTHALEHRVVRCSGLFDMIRDLPD